MLHEANQSTLVLVDLQQRLMPSIFEGERVISQDESWWAIQILVTYDNRCRYGG